jgi:hypothetical protein
VQNAFFCLILTKNVLYLPYVGIGINFNGETRELDPFKKADLD